MSPAEAPLAEILAALELPPHALARWLDDLEKFCHAHGGERHYQDLLALIAECRRSRAS
jgi:hypothetical protein